MISPIFFKDGYKSDHRRQFPKGTQVVYSNFTARGSRIKGIDETVTFQIQVLIKDYLIRRFNDGFFNRPKEEILSNYKRIMDSYLGKDAISVEHIAALHDLGYLPVHIKALPEGMLCPMRVPFMTIVNTLPEFFWLTNFLETLISVALWHPITSATIAYQFKKMLDKYVVETSDIPEFVMFQAHDFSMRGQTSVESALASGGGHLLSFVGTDTIPSLLWLEHFYNTDCEKEMLGKSVAATEHAVMCMGGKETEIETYRRLIGEIYPSGIISIVSDTWDYWKVLIDTLPLLKAEIMARDGKVVIRPDSGDPVKIICGDKDAKKLWEYNGTVETLWNIFGGTVNSKGFKQLDPHIGVIYGDGITLERCEQINAGLKEKGFASTNMVYGIGSYTYQYVTRDTFGFAMKATYGEIDGEAVEIFKDPKTDNGLKKSAKGLLAVHRDPETNKLFLKEQCTKEEEKLGLLETVFLDGKIIREYSLSEIRERLKAS